MAKMITGSITEHRTRDGRILHRVRLPIDGKRRSLGLYETEEQARTVRDAALAQYVSTGEERGIRLVDWGETWLTRRALDGLHRNVPKSVSTWRTHVATAPFASWPMRRITRQDIHRWVKALLRAEPTTAVNRGRGSRRTTERRKQEGKRLSRQTVVNALALLRRALADAADEGLIPSNPALGVSVPRVARLDEPWTFLVASEVERLLGLPLRDEQRSIFTTAIFTGLRGGELWGLRWRDVRLAGDRPELHVCRSYRGPTKSGKTRHVPLLAPALEALRAWKALRPGVGDALVFPAGGGGCHAEGFDAGLLRALRLAGVERRVRFHDLRHTCASHLVMGTWAPRPLRLEAVKTWLGHSTLTVTERYAHLGPDELHAIAAEARKAER